MFNHVSLDQIPEAGSPLYDSGVVFLTVIHASGRVVFLDETARPWLIKAADKGHARFWMTLGVNSPAVAEWHLRQLSQHLDIYMRQHLAGEDPTAGRAIAHRLIEMATCDVRARKAMDMGWIVMEPLNYVSALYQRGLMSGEWDPRSQACAEASLEVAKLANAEQVFLYNPPLTLSINEALAEIGRDWSVAYPCGTSR
jgi:hypothetical protein